MPHQFASTHQFASQETNNDSNMRVLARASLERVKQPVRHNVRDFPSSQTFTGLLTSHMNDEACHQKMTKGQPRAPTGTSNFVTKKEKANWDHLTTKIFCEVCAEEVHAGNRPNTHFNRVGWENVVNKFQRRTRRNYDQKQLKNKWESLKNQYKAWQQLIGSETGLGWDHNKGTVDADDAWWAEKEKVDPEVASFRYNGIENLTEMEVMFSKTFATGDNSFNPYMVTETEDDEGYDATNDAFNDNMAGDESNVDLENIEVSNDLPLEKDHQHVKKRKETAGNERKSHIARKGKKSKVSTALVMQSQLDRICIVMETTVANSQTKDQSGYSISECIAVLKNIPSIQPRSELFMLGTRLFVKREYREIFIALEEDDLRVNWLDEELKREKNHTPRR